MGIWKCPVRLGRIPLKLKQGARQLLFFDVISYRLGGVSKVEKTRVLGPVLLFILELPRTISIYENTPQNFARRRFWYRWNVNDSTPSWSVLRRHLT